VEASELAEVACLEESHVSIEQDSDHEYGTLADYVYHQCKYQRYHLSFSEATRRDQAADLQLCSRRPRPARRLSRH
jgi:hypothetical protein